MTTMAAITDQVSATQCGHQGGVGQQGDAEAQQRERRVGQGAGRKVISGALQEKEGREYSWTGSAASAFVVRHGVV
jgi:hypothetical protein